MWVKPILHPNCLFMCTFIVYTCTEVHRFLKIKRTTERTVPYLMHNIPNCIAGCRLLISMKVRVLQVVSNFLQNSIRRWVNHLDNLSPVQEEQKQVQITKLSDRYCSRPTAESSWANWYRSTPRISMPQCSWRSWKGTGRHIWLKSRAWSCAGTWWCWGITILVAGLTSWRYQSSFICFTSGR